MQGLDDVEGENDATGEDRDSHQDAKNQRLSQSGDGQHATVRGERHTPEVVTRCRALTTGFPGITGGQDARKRPRNEPAPNAFLVFLTDSRLSGSVDP
jgi:hypothetical protein